MQKVSWLLQPMNTLIGQHLQTLKDCPPVQGGRSYDLSKLAADVLKKGRALFRPFCAQCI